MSDSTSIINCRLQQDSMLPTDMLCMIDKCQFVQAYIQETPYRIRQIDNVSGNENTVSLALGRDDYDTKTEV